MSPNVVIIGAGQAAAQACQSLRAFGYAGSITVIGDEDDLPYQRPPLSKAYMKGELEKERLYFKPASWFLAQKIDLILSEKVTAIDLQDKKVRVGKSGYVSFDKLIIATGARPRRLAVPGGDLSGVFDLRSLSDVDRIQPQMIANKRLVIIGAGYIGLEAAAVAQTLGLRVTVLEMAERVLARVAGPIVSDFYTAIHRDRGVDIRTSAEVTSLGGTQSVEYVALSDGTRIPADLVLVGIGVLPNIELARDAGLSCENGIVTDRDTRTSDPSAFAIGDCAQRPLVHYNRQGRLESVHNAIEQGKIAAAIIAGKPRAPEDCPWFWSDQFDVKLQIAGLLEGHDARVLRGSPEDGKFSVFYLKDKRLIAVEAINSPPEFIVSKKLIIANASPSAEMLADTSISMKIIAASNP